ncbi:hypothetical protein CHGG_09233 [Chaetomium globosum CBS 148.51]|uniref:Cytidyltransferase-like domain-containing protein n=1 Tax=Chaetomium globosum (strain ATCC 6205 / CBS 148.51 / DSM 1962 / NBRC 6347 / NRRL 1970) TaxID=306901 RepID=Q2GS21_CHAGB|nr:uncharacterized protein CHGG_09233 [Chaetomium globosum CBS 148.51]EAQ85219.1 hypothetical protein CHGG_09233 [Chaetomium globosum CBS 148.51]
MTAGTINSDTQTPTAMGPAVDGAQAPYNFPTQKLKRQMTQPGKTPLVLVACGSFSPITYLHLRMFEMAGDFVRFNTDFEVCAGYLSPVSDAYKKVGLAPGSHRVNMCGRAVEQSPWLMVDPFETVNCDENGEPQYVPTAKVLRHFDHEINTVLGGIEAPDGQMKKARIALLAGADLVMSMGGFDTGSRVSNVKLTCTRGAWALGSKGSGHDPRVVRRFHHRALGD